MNFKLLTVLLLIALLTIDIGDSWGGRRRRRRGGKRRGRRGFWKKAKKYAKKAYKYYKKNKKTIHRVVRIGIGAARIWDSESFKNLALLKNENIDSYEEYMDNVRDALDNYQPEEDVEEFMEWFDSVVDMDDEDRDEYLELLKKEDDNVEPMPFLDQLKQELDMKVANLA